MQEGRREEARAQEDRSGEEAQEEVGFPQVQHLTGCLSADVQSGR